MINLVALEGRLARPAEQRVLPSGDQVVSMELTVRRDGGPTLRGGPHVIFRGA